MIKLTAALRLALAGIAAAVFLLVSRPSWAEFKPPPFDKQHGQVIDDAGKLSAGERAFLQGKIERNRRATGFPVVVYLPRSLEGEAIEDVAYKTFQEWKLGDAANDNATLFVIAPNERRIRIETGKGVGGALTDLQTHVILRERVGPLLKEDRFRDAIDAGVDGIYAALSKDPNAAPVKQTKKKPTPAAGGFGGLMFLLIPFGIFFIFLSWLSRMRARGGRDWHEGGHGGGGGGGGFIIFPGGFGGGGGDWGGGGGGGGGSDWGGGSSGDYSGGGESGGGGSSDSY